MDTDFWIRKWEKNEIVFHEGQPNALLVSYFKVLNLVEGSRVFLPLCGKTRDIAWLLSKGHKVVGAELSKLAVEQLFAELEVEPTITKLDEVTGYSAQNIDIFLGDVFALSCDMLGTVDAIYDRAALVALPPEMRTRYTKHMQEITDKARQLLITFEYDQSLMAGPPFSLTNDEINRHYESAYRITLLDGMPVPGKLKGICEAIESIRLLENKV